MKILIAPDKFKGTLSAAEAAETAAHAFRKVLPQAEVQVLPLADGGEGTVSALTCAMHGTLHSVQVRDPLGRPVPAQYGVCGGTFVLEMSAASGLALLKKEECDPMKTDTFGTGEMIRCALDGGASEIIMGIGGSATCDGGAGMAEALGAKFYDAAGKELHRIGGGDLRKIAGADLSALDTRLKTCRISIASDVRNPLLGANGAVAVFAPQKGATAATMPLLEAGLEIFVRVLHCPADHPGDGAAGGLGYGLRTFCGGEFLSGAQLVMEKSGFLKELETADLVLTGEGCTDSQSEGGKVCCEVAAACRKKGVPCVLLSGCIGLPREILSRDFTAVFTSGIGRCTREACFAHAAEDLAAAASSVAQLISLGAMAGR